MMCIHGNHWPHPLDTSFPHQTSAPSVNSSASLPNHYDKNSSSSLGNNNLKRNRSFRDSFRKAFTRYAKIQSSIHSFVYTLLHWSPYTVTLHTDSECYVALIRSCFCICKGRRMVQKKLDKTTMDPWNR